MVKGIQPITPFTSPKESTGDTASIWTLFSHTGGYVMAIRLLIPAGLWIFCCYFFWCRPARLACWPLQPDTIQYTIVDDDVEAASIYRCGGKAQQPTRSHKNHGLHMEHIPTWTGSQYKQQTQSLVVPAQGNYFQNPGNTEMYIISVVRLRITPYAVPYGLFDWCSIKWQ